MSGPQLDAGVEVQAPAKNNNDQQQGGSNFNGSIAKASSVASRFLSEVKTIEIGLETKVIELESQITGYELAVRVLSNQVNSLKEELANQPDCDEDDGYAKSETPEQMAGEVPRRSTSGNRQATLD